jgi:FkbM family methyltransferase
VIETKTITVHGRDWIVPATNNDGQFRFMSHEIFNLKVYDYHLCPINTDDVVIDVGANIGMFTSYCFEKLAKRIIAIEPGETFECLLKNTFPYLENITYKNVAAWNYETQLEFIDRLDESGQSQVVRSNNSLGYRTVKLEAQSIDRIINRTDIEKIDFIKIDTEGSELEALLGAEYIIKTFKPKLAVCLYHNKEDWNLLPEVIFDMVHSYKMTKVSYRETRCDIGYFY